MHDKEIKQLAHNLINYSVKLKPGEKVLIDNINMETQLAKELIKEAYLAGGIPFLNFESSYLKRELLKEATIEQLKITAHYELERMKQMDAYIGIRAAHNINELSGLPEEKIKMLTEHVIKPVHYDQRVNHTKWCILRYPTPSMAQLANMSTEDFAAFFFDVCNLDYAKMSRAMDALVDIMEKTDKVRLTASGTDLTFSIKDMPAIKCAGSHNIPDGEVYTAPVKDSVNGMITYNTPSVHDGITYENIRLEFKNGKIVKATANLTERINKIFDMDEGARYVGEFAIGVNPYILNPMKDTLFDEKISGSIHFTPGSSYDDCNNGNKSAIHWDLVLIQRSEFGGGEIYFDDVLVRKDGIFVLESLQALNPENLKG